MSWYERSYGWIQQQQLEHPELSRDELRKHCSKNYPFHHRWGWAYKSWLKAMREYFGATRRPKPTAQIELLDV